MKQIRLAALIVTTGLAACSSVPDFRPSKPLEEASSLNEALDLCASYEIGGERTASGMAHPARAVVLVPWVRCFEDLFRKLPQAKDREGLVMFFRALQAKHAASIPDDREFIDWPVVNHAVRVSVEHIKNPSLAYSDEERRSIGRQFPGYAIYLSESGRFSAPLSKSDVRSRDLEELRREIGEPGGAATGAFALGDEDRPGGPRPYPLTAAQKEYCKRYRAYRSLVHNVEELADYKRILEERSREDGAAESESAMRERIAGRFESMKKEAVRRKGELSTELRGLQAKAGWFRGAHCFEGSSRLVPRKES